MDNLLLEPLPHTHQHILTGKYQTPFAKSRTVIVRLDNHKKYLVYSPGEPLLEQAKELLGEDADVVLVAPSLGHTLGLAAWLKAYPEARLVAHSAPLDVLAKAGLAEFALVSPAELVNELPEHIKILPVPMCNSGEIWLTVTLEGQVYWLVCDAMMNLSALSDSFIKALLQRLYGLRLGLWMAPSFIRGVTDKPGFKNWLTGWLKETQPAVFIPCHGDVYSEPDLIARLQTLVEARL